MNRYILGLICLGVSVFSLVGSTESASPRQRERGRVEAIFINGRIYTMDETLPVAEAIAVGGGKVLGVGTTDEMIQLRGPGTVEYDLEGLTVIPGLVDAHAHFTGYALGRSSIDLKGTSSFSEVAGFVVERVSKTAKGDWITGRGWDQNDWDFSEYPQTGDIDSVSVENPVFLIRVCGHAAFANSFALRLAGIDRDTPDPPGGRILHDSDGRLTGILIDSAIELVRKIIPSHSREEKKRLFTEAARQCLSVGLTGIHEMGISGETASIYRELYMEEVLAIRLTVYYLHDDEVIDSLLDAGHMTGFGDDHFEVAGVKFFIDGSLGARSAALLDDYSDDPGNSGFLVIDPDELYRQILKCHKKGFSVAIHAIGDRGNRIALDVLEKAVAEGLLEDNRDRIEHAQILSIDDIGRFASLGVIPSMQFTHCTSDMPWVEKRLGPDRIKGAYAWRSLINEGCRIPGGSDFPVESIDPLLGIYAAVTRQDLDGNPGGGWRSSQCLTVQEAVRAFTLDAAWAVHQDQVRGSLEKGKVADFIVLSDDIMQIDSRRIPDIDVFATILGGMIEYRSSESPF